MVKVLRDVTQRGRKVEGILIQYMTFVKPAFDELIKPTMRKANLIIPGGASNKVARKFLVANLKLHLARMNTLKKEMHDGAYFGDILDTCWANVKEKDLKEMGEIGDKEENELQLHQSDRILCLNKPQLKADYIKSFKLFLETFNIDFFM